MKTENERFDELWAAMKEKVREARTNRPFIQTQQDLPKMERLMFSGTARIGGADIDGANIYIARHTWEGSVSMNSEDLIALAAQSIAAAQEIEEAKEQRANAAA